MVFKLRALEAYNAEMRDYPHSRSIEELKNLAKPRVIRLAMIAEAFEVVRKLEN